MFKKVFALAAAFFASLFAFPAVAAPAAGPDFTSLTSGVDWSTTGPAILLVTVGLVGVYVIMKASGLILQRIRNG